MNVLHIIPSMNPDSGGTSQGIRNIIPELEKLGIKNEVVCLDDPSDKFLTKDPFINTALGPSKGPWQYSSKLIPWLFENIGRFDVIIVNALWLYHGYAFRKALKKYQKAYGNGDVKTPKFFVMPHGMLDPYFQQAPERKIKALRNWLYWKLIESKLVNTADGMLFTCEAELLLARKPFYPYHPKKEFNVGYGAEVPPVYNDRMTSAFFEKCPEVKGQPYFLFLSRIHEKKGVDHLIEAYSNVLDTFENNGIDNATSVLPKLVIAGPGIETPFGKRIEELVATSTKLHESVYFPGMLAGDAKWGAFYAAEAFVLVSHQENFGIAVVEALACGKPVLISKQVNIWHEIIEGGGGIVEDDTTLGAIKILKGWNKLTRDEIEAMGTNALRVYENYFRIETAAKKLKEVLNEY